MTRLNYEVRFVEHYEEPFFTEQVNVFFDQDQRLAALQRLLSVEEFSQKQLLGGSLPKRVSLKAAAFLQGQLIGWSYGWFEAGGDFYVAISGVLPEYRRHGVYSALTEKLIEEVKARGSGVVYSRHWVTNNAILIAKLKLGFTIVGVEYSEELGLLVRLVKHLYPERAKLYQDRAGALK